MKYSIYKTTNLINGKFYIGKHQSENINDNYIGSGIALKRAIKQYGIENFKKEILFIFDTELEMNMKEKEIITEEFVLRKDTYNVGIGGEGGAHFKGKSHSKEVREKIRKSLSTPEAKEKAIQYGRMAGLASKGRKLSGAARKNMSEAAKKRKPRNST